MGMKLPFLVIIAPPLISPLFWFMSSFPKQWKGGGGGGDTLPTPLKGRWSKYPSRPGAFSRVGSLHRDWALPFP